MIAVSKYIGIILTAHLLISEFCQSLAPLALRLLFEQLPHNAARRNHHRVADVQTVFCCRLFVRVAARWAAGQDGFRLQKTCSDLCPKATSQPLDRTSKAYFNGLHKLLDVSRGPTCGGHLQQRALSLLAQLLSLFDLQQIGQLWT